MFNQQTELKAALLAQAETAIEALLAKKPSADQITLSEIEELVGEMGQQLEQATTQALLNEAQAASSQPPGCPQCGGKLRYKGQRRKHVATVRGEVVLERAYYYCETCQAGLFPL